MRILLVEPPVKENLFGTSLAIAYLSAYLRQNGYTVSAIDMMNFKDGEPEKRLRIAVEKFTPDVIGFSVVNLAYLNTISLVNSLSSYFKGIVVCGGPEVTAQGNNFLKNVNGIDIAVIGEGEDTLCELLKHFKSGEDIKNVSGIAYRDKKTNEIVLTPPRGLRKNLDDLPLPDFEIFGLKEFDLYTILTSRGCPFSCIFCATEARGRSWRTRDVRLCIDELKIAMGRYKIKGFQIFDPVFNLKPDRVEEFCELLIKEGINLPWIAWGIRADRLTDSSTKMMKRAGCGRIAVGIETMNPEVAKFMKKGEDIEEIKKGIKIAIKNGLSVAGYMLSGLPFDTFEGTIKSFEEAQKLDLDELLYQYAVPFTNTELEKWMNKNAKKLNTSFQVNTMENNLTDFAYETPEFTKEERAKAKFILNIKSQAYFESDIPRIIFYIKKAYYIIRYDYKNILRRLKRAYRYRKGFKNFFGELFIRRAVYYRLPDGTWGLSKNENIDKTGKYFTYLKDGKLVIDVSGN